jgi:hypothetical protein
MLQPDVSLRPRRGHDDPAGRSLCSKIAKESVPQNVERYMTLEIADQAKEVSAAAK